MYEKYTIYDENYPSSAQLLIFCNAHLNSKTFTKKNLKKLIKIEAILGGILIVLPGAIPWH